MLDDRVNQELTAFDSRVLENCVPQHAKLHLPGYKFKRFKVVAFGLRSRNIGNKFWRVDVVFVDWRLLVDETQNFLLSTVSTASTRRALVLLSRQLAISNSQQQQLQMISGQQKGSAPTPDGSISSGVGRATKSSIAGGKKVNLSHNRSWVVNQARVVDMLMAEKKIAL